MKKKIMVVDDDIALTKTIKFMLEDSNNYNVISANSGFECLQKLKNNDIPDLILLDIMMPEMNGWQVLEKIKENDNWKNIPIIILTARTDDLAKNASNFLADDFIEKPYTDKILKGHIQKILENNPKVE
jgi:two-component system alkaline phosphatase synthesis response regulator PhoP